MVVRPLRYAKARPFAIPTWRRPARPQVCNEDQRERLLEQLRVQLPYLKK